MAWRFAESTSAEVFDASEPLLNGWQSQSSSTFEPRVVSFGVSRLGLEDIGARLPELGLARHGALCSRMCAPGMLHSGRAVRVVDR